MSMKLYLTCFTSNVMNKTDFPTAEFSYSYAYTESRKPDLSSRPAIDTDTEEEILDEVERGPFRSVRQISKRLTSHVYLVSAQNWMPYFYSTLVGATPNRIRDTLAKT